MVGPKTARTRGDRSRHDVARRWLVPYLLAVGLLAACGRGTATLSDLGGLEDLKDRFNRDAGKIRIVLLLSPT